MGSATLTTSARADLVIVATGADDGIFTHVTMSSQIKAVISIAFLISPS